MQRLLAVIPIVLVLPAAAAHSAADWRGDVEEKTPPRFQAFEIGGFGMNVPVGFLRYEAPPDGRIRKRNYVGGEVYFHALAPDLLPPPKDLKPLWKGGNGFPPYVSFNISVTLQGLKESAL